MYLCENPYIFRFTSHSHSTLSITHVCGTVWEDVGALCFGLNINILPLPSSICRKCSLTMHLLARGLRPSLCGCENELRLVSFNIDVGESAGEGDERRMCWDISGMRAAAWRCSGPPTLKTILTTHPCCGSHKRSTTSPDNV